MMRYIKAVSHLKKITKTASDAKGLKGIHQNNDYIEATDAARLLRVTIPHVTFDDAVIDIQTGDVKTSDYPNTDKMLEGVTQADDYMALGQDDLKELLEMLSMINEKEKKFIMLREDGTIEPENSDGRITLKFNKPSLGGIKRDAKYNVTYLKEMLSAFDALDDKAMLQVVKKGDFYILKVTSSGLTGLLMPVKSE